MFDKGTGSGLTWNYGDDLVIDGDGKIGIGTTLPDQKLTVNGTVHAKEVLVDLSIPLPHYVFKPTYNLASLKDVKTYIGQNHHLSDMPSEQQVAKNGLNLGEMNAKLLKKVEELTLYLIEKDSEIQQQSKVNNRLELKVKILKKRMTKIEKH